jgi:hypothetical protein
MEIIILADKRPNTDIRHVQMSLANHSRSVKNERKSVEICMNSKEDETNS